MPASHPDFVPTPAWFRGVRTAVKRWYPLHGRTLPWRGTGNPYAVWLSEIMLQQTTVTAVKPYFARFLERFPTVQDLANAEEVEVLRLWEGLGYYSRARNLHRAAKMVAGELQGQFPSQLEGLLKLPGVGRYTAGAIATFAFDQPAPIVEANTLRLYCRLLGYSDDPRASRGQEVLWQFAADVIPRKQAGDFNQALMDLGATVCTPVPNCEVCPLQKFCQAFQTNQQASIPRKATRPALTELIEVAVVVRDEQGRIFLHRRPAGARWAGLWDFPRLSWPKPSCEKPSEMTNWCVAELRSQFQLTVGDLEPLTEMQHGVTRYRIRLICFLARLSTPSSASEESERRWVREAELSEFPLPVTGRKIAKLLGGKEGGRMKERIPLVRHWE